MDSQSAANALTTCSSYQTCVPDADAQPQASSVISSVQDSRSIDPVKEECTSYISPLPPPPPPTRSRPTKSLRFYVAATDLIEHGPRSRGACAIIYIRESNSIRAQLSNVTLSSEDGSPVRRPPSSRSMREARTLVGQTEIARLSGRDVEFARTFTIPYETPCAQVVHIDMYGCDCRDASRNWLLGVAEIPLTQLYSARGYKTAVPIAFVPTGAEKERHRKGNAGTFQLAVEDITVGLDEYRLDIQCEQMKRSKAWSSGLVKRAHYTIHTIASNDENCDDWVLLFRSDRVEMVKKKRDGGSLEYNYFSSRPLLAVPGIIVADTDEKDNADSVLHKVVCKLKNRHSGQFFSLPSGAISCVSPDRRLKLSVYDDSSAIGGYDLIADTQFTISELRAMNLADSTEVQVNSNPVGRATLKFVECGNEPKYFCLSICMPHLK